MIGETIDLSSFDTQETITRRLGVLEWPTPVPGEFHELNGSFAEERLVITEQFSTSSREGDAVWGNLTPADALRWRVLTFISMFPGSRGEQVAEALQVEDLLVFEIVDELRAKGLVGPA